MSRPRLASAVRAAQPACRSPRLDGAIVADSRPNSSARAAALRPPGLLRPLAKHRFMSSISSQAAIDMPAPAGLEIEPVRRSLQQRILPGPIDGVAEVDPQCQLGVVTSRSFGAGRYIGTAPKRQCAAAVRPGTVALGRTAAAADLVVGDRLLPLRRHQPVDERLAELLLHVRMLGRIHQDDAVLVEQPVVALDHDVEVAAVLERQPGAAVGQHIGVGRRRRC